jgi:hypothetical protein
MPVQTPKTRFQFDWRYPLYAAFGAVISFVAVMVVGGEFFGFLHLIVVVPIVSIALLCFAIFAAMRRNFRQAVSIVLALIVYCATSFALYSRGFELRTTVRWLFASNAYKARLTAEPAPSDELLKHIGWDVWGFAGNDTFAYLVFDPNDLLGPAATSNSSGDFGGLPCKVYRVRRMESHYYVVLFYTDKDWDHCD